MTTLSSQTVLRFTARHCRILEVVPTTYSTLPTRSWLNSGCQAPNSNSTGPKCHRSIQQPPQVNSKVTGAYEHIRNEFSLIITLKYLTIDMRFTCTENRVVISYIKLISVPSNSRHELQYEIFAHIPLHSVSENLQQSPKPFPSSFLAEGT